MKKLNTITIGFENLRRQSVRTTVMIIFSLILSASLLVSAIIKESMEQSVKQTVNRMGADIIVVPQEYASTYTDALFTGEHCSFYFDKSWYDDVVGVKGIMQASPQLYIASLAAECCSSPVQIIAFEPKTDFIVQSWMTEIGISELKDGEVLIGNEVTSQVGENIRFFDEQLLVAGKLEHTGTGYDTCAFVNFNTAKKMLEKEQVRKASLGDKDPNSVISSIMIRIEDGKDAKAIARAINYGIENSPLRAYTANGVISTVADSVESFSVFANILNYLLMLVSVLAIICVFSITIIQRKNEFGVMLTIGAGKDKLVKILLTEGIAVCFLGGVIGMIVSGGVILAFKDVLLVKLGIPALTGEISFYIVTALKCLSVSVTAGLLASICAIILITQKEPLYLIKEINA